MKRPTTQFVFVATFVICALASAEVGDPPAVVDGNIVYRSRANYVEARKTDSEEVLWKTELYPNMRPQIYDPRVEQDVQRNVIRKIELQGDLLRVIDSRGRIYWLDKNTGKKKDQ